VEAQRDDPSSMLWLYKRLLAARRASLALRRGTLRLLDGAPDGVVAWERTDTASGDRRIVAVSMSTEDVRLPVDGATVEVASDGPAGEGDKWSGILAPGQAVVLRP
jgi:alpha-glucosidase